MRFRLLEYQDFPTADDAVEQSEKEYISDIKKADSYEKKDTALKALISFLSSEKRASKSLLDDSYKNIRRVMLSSFEKDGYSLNSNKFIKYILKNSDIIKSNYDSKMDILQQLMSAGLINYKTNQKWWSDPSLYDRDDDEFEYTIKIFNIASDPDVAKTYYDNPDGISVDDLYINGKIKKSGLHDHDNKKDKSIWNQVESWAKKYSEKDVDDIGNAERLYSIRDAFNYMDYKGSSLDDDINNLIDVLNKENIVEKDRLTTVKMVLSRDSKYANELLSKKALKSFENGTISKFIQKEFNL